MSSTSLRLGCVVASLVFAGPAFTQELTPEHEKPKEPAPAPLPIPAPSDEMVDAKTTKRILAFLNGSKTVEEIVGVTGMEASTAKLILDLRDGLAADEEASASGFTSLVQLQPAFTLSHACFAHLYHCFGPSKWGRWDTLPYQAPWSPVNTTLLKNGLVLFFEETNSVRTTQWDPRDFVNPVFIDPDNDPDFSLWCSQTAQLHDGRVLAVGGGGGSPTVNSDQAYVFDPDAGLNGVWTRISDMTAGRWYPSVVALGYPFTLIASGWGVPGGVIPTMEIFNEITNTFTEVPGASSHLDWSPLYPGLHPLANGRIVFTRTGFSGSPSVPLTQYFEWKDASPPTTGAWHDLALLAFSNRTEAMSMQFMSPSDTVYEYTSKVAVFGGGQSPEPVSVTAEILDAENLVPGQAWRRLPDMAEPRNHCQGILLPDGKAILWGGANHGNNGLAGSFTSELFDPCSETFERQDSLQYARGYHSAAALLPSGQVLASGGISGALERTMEIYSPPYLFRGPRPVIKSMPAMKEHGQPFYIYTANAKEIDKVVLVRPVSNTHNTDSEQRVLELRFTREPDADRVRATMPAGVHPYPHAPRGYYLLFILDCDGIPSVGKFIFLC